MRKITHVHPLPGYRLDLTFDTGETGIADVSGLTGKGVFEIWLDVDAFNSVTIGPSGQLCWGEKIDLCPDALYLQAMGLEVEELFPNLQALTY